MRLEVPVWPWRAVLSLVTVAYLLNKEEKEVRNLIDDHISIINLIHKNKKVGNV
jgi:hypothetical protein